MRTKILSTLAITLLALSFAGCRTNKDQACCGASMTNATSSTVAPAPAAPAPAPMMATTSSEPAPKLAPPIRIKAGTGDAFKDADGNQWIPEQGFAEGDTAERPDVEIANTKTPQIYRSEHYSMTSFSLPVPNGNYIVKLHFCETYDGIEGPGQRVFSFNVEGHQFNDFDVWVKAGGPLRAYIETVPVEVADGKLDITFTPKVENPQINGIEILPAS